jgi:hypothetical protein
MGGGYAEPAAKLVRIFIRFVSLSRLADYNPLRNECRHPELLQAQGCCTTFRVNETDNREGR